MGFFSLIRDKVGVTESVALEELSAPDIRSKSAFFSNGIIGKTARFEELNQPGREPTTTSLILQSSAKSFTAGSQRNHIATAVKLKRDRDGENDGTESPADVVYKSIDEFNSVVELYRGSISTVYRAICSQTRRPVIIKAYQLQKMKEKNFLRLEREIRLMRLLIHDESVVQLYNVFQEGQFKYLIMEMCKGGDLFKAMLLRGGKMEESWVCREMVAPLLSTLVRLHAQHVIHRDIKPENIMLTSSQKFKLGDFGLAIKSDVELPYARSGTLDYLSPEVLANPTWEVQESPKITRADLKQKGIRPYDEKVDCWAAGVLAYELVVGRPPFEVKDEAKTASAIMYKNDFPLPSKYSPQWADFVKQALQKNPAIRPSAKHLLSHPWVQMHIPEVLPPPDQPHLLLQSLSLKKPPTYDLVLPSGPRGSLPSSETQRILTADFLGAPQNTNQESGHGSNLTPQPSKLGIRTSPLLTEGSLRGEIVSQFSASGSSLSGSPVSILGKEHRPSPSSPAHHDKKSLVHQLQAEASHSSFSALLANAPSGDAGYMDSGNILEPEKRKAGGMKIRMQHYFKRQAPMA